MKACKPPCPVIRAAIAVVLVTAPVAARVAATQVAATARVVVRVAATAAEALALVPAAPVLVKPVPRCRKRTLKTKSAKPWPGWAQVPAVNARKCAAVNATQCVNALKWPKWQPLRAAYCR